jgi:hypothetical protein
MEHRRLSVLKREVLQLSRDVKTSAKKSGALVERDAETFQVIVTGNLHGEIACESTC